MEFKVEERYKELKELLLEELYHELHLVLGEYDDFSQSITMKQNEIRRITAIATSGQFVVVAVEGCAKITTSIDEVKTWFLEYFGR